MNILDNYMRIKKVGNKGSIIISENDKIYVCPYCATLGRIIDFRQIKDNGEISKGYAKCRKCFNVMKMRTLKVDMSIEDWTKYLYYNIRIQKYGSEFYHKINWDILFNNLKKYGFYAEFLKYWYKTKREYSKEKANDFFNELYKSL
jgi:hypothetical protein